MDVRIALGFVLAMAVSGTALGQDVGQAGADIGSVGFRNHALPVLVRVDKQGRVTDMQPARRLRPNMRRLLRKTLDQMIVSPAMRHGRAVRSQFVMQLAVEASKQADGKYKVHFEYVSSMPVPLLPLHWIRTEGDRLALSTPPAFNGDWRRNRYEVIRNLDRYNPEIPGPINPNQPPVQSPTTQSAGVRVAQVGGPRR